MKLYHEVRGCSLAVDIVARELGITLELEWVEMSTKRLRDGSDYHLVNSKGTVPTLEVPDGQRLSEGSIIMQYLVDQHPGSDLLPPCGTMERYRVLEWMSFIGADLHKGGFMPLFKKATPQEYRQIACAYLQRHLGWLDTQLIGHSFLVGERFTIADAHCYTIVMWTAAHGISTKRWPNIARYLTQIGQRASVQAAEQAAREQA